MKKDEVYQVPFKRAKQFTIKLMCSGKNMGVRSTNILHFILDNLC